MARERGKELVDWIRRFVQRQPGEVPVFPAIAVRIVHVLKQREVAVETAASVVDQDQAIAAKILRAANSALYAAAVPAETISDAIMRIGFRESMNIATLAAYQTLFDTEDRAELECRPELWRALWHGSLAASFGARSLSREIGAGEPDQVFLGGLMRHVGSLLALRMIARGRVRGILRFEPTDDDIALAFRELDTELGVDYLRRSKLPDPLIDAVADGGDPEVAGALDVASLEILRLADGMLHRIGLAPFARGELGPEAERSARALGLDDDALELHRLQFEALVEQVHELL